MEASGERIDLVYTTGPKAELHKPRVLLGSVLMRWVHWQGGISSPCLQEYKLPCAKCASCDQSEYAYIAAALLEAPVKVAAAEPPSDVMVRRRWEAMETWERDEYRTAALLAKPFLAKYPAMLDDAARLCMAPRAPEAAEKSAGYIIGQRIVQCVPEFAVARMDLESLRGQVVKLTIDRKSRVTIKALPFAIEPPADFDPHPTYMRRYGLHRLVKPATLKVWREA